MRATLAIGILVLANSIGLPAEPSHDGLPHPTGNSIVAADAKLELLFTRTAEIEGGLTEGPAVAPDGSRFQATVFGSLFRFSAD
ncbi:MAG: hypothetical protein CMJ59_20340 [Planctomycetaceae bacterium]|nr:hypothetical protein [Planctomycetaceae bacterium]